MIIISSIYFSKSTNQWRVKNCGKTIAAYGISNNGDYAKILAEQTLQTGLKYHNYITHDGKYAYIHLYNKKYGYMDSIIDTDDLYLITSFRWYIRKQGKHFYCETTVNGNKVKLHKIITHTNKTQTIDHIDRNGLNNTKANLRITTTSINGKNSTGYSTNNTGFTGVSYSPIDNKIYAYWMVNKKQIGKSYDVDAYGYDYCLNKAIVDRYMNAIKYDYRFSDKEIEIYETAKRYVENIV